MPGWQSRLTQLIIRLRIKRRITGGEQEIVRFARARFGDTRLAQRMTPKNVRLQPINEQALQGEWVGWDGQDQQRVILYFHGGAYVACSPVTHRPFTAELSRQAGMRVFALDYRLAPEHRFPAQIEDAVTAYRWLLQQGFEPHNIILGGDSAGGGLTIATLIKLRDLGMPLPALGFCFSPWADMTASGDSYRTNHKNDPMFYGDSTKLLAPIYLGDAAPSDPLASPVFADLTGLPPLYVYAGSTEVLLDDARKLVARAHECGVSAELHIADRQPHVWPIMVGILPEAKQTIRQVVTQIHHILNKAKASQAVEMM